jgi:hypothetical protein
MGGVPEGLSTIVKGVLPILLPAIVGDALAKLGIPEAISKPVMMMVVMPLLAWIIPKLAVIVSDIVWAAAEGVEPPPTYKAEGTVTMIAGGETRYIDFSQSCEATVPPLPPPLTISLEAGGLL